MVSRRCLSRGYSRVSKGESMKLEPESRSIVREILDGEDEIGELMLCFPFSETPQGADYWSDVCDMNDLPIAARRYLESLLATDSTLPDSGSRTEFNTGAVRDAMSGKGLPSLIPPEAIRRLARRFEDGAAKYGRDNWQKGIPLSRYNDAIIRHTLAAAEGQTDEDHLGAVLWNAAAWIWTEAAISAGALPAELDDRAYTA
jgi:hypothetical protein